MSVIDRFVRRLSRIGVDVSLECNAPWVYLTSVNGVKVEEKYRSKHGFTAFFLQTTIDGNTRFSDRRRVFQKIRSALRYGCER